VSADMLSTGALLRIISFYGHFEIAILLNMHDIKVKTSEKTDRHNKADDDDDGGGLQMFFQNKSLHCNTA
jgi:hypothetical protein